MTRRLLRNSLPYGVPLGLDLEAAPMTKTSILADLTGLRVRNTTGRTAFACVITRKDCITFRLKIRENNASEIRLVFEAFFYCDYVIYRQTPRSGRETGL